MSRVLVTGGSGFLGSHIADALSARGESVIVFDKVSSPYLRDSQEIVLGDITDADEVRNAANGCDVIYHLAGFSDLNAARTRPVESAQVNMMGTINVLEAARATGVRRLLFASTVYVYSREGGFYRCSKQACESYIEEYHRTFGLPYTILRYGSLYGPRADERNGVYRLLVAAATTGRIEHVGGPEDVREYVHVQDAAELSVDALAAEYEDQHLIITGHDPLRARDLFTMFSEILGRELEVSYSDPADQPVPHGHYRMTPYAYNPKIGRKMTSSTYVDMGQGLLQLVDEIDREHGVTAGRLQSRTTEDG